MKLSQPIPILRILDEAKAREFYVDFLGFAVDWEHRVDDDAPLYLQLSRGECVIHLSEHYGDCNSGSALRIETDDVDSLNRDLLAKSYKYARPGVHDTPWKTREMDLKDPFGNRLVFCQRDGEKARDASMTPVGSTARWIAANRALETESAAPLYRDPFARQLAGDSGFAMMAEMRAVLGMLNSSMPDPYLSIRTKYFDDTMLAAVVNGSLTQAVLMAAGMDTRAFRIDWPKGLTLFEVDRDDVFDHKEPVLERFGVEPRCTRRIVRFDLTRSPAEALLTAGFEPARPAAILVEGLLMYLDESDVRHLFETLRTIAKTGSWIGLDAVNTEMLKSPYTEAYMKKLADAGCPWRFGVDDPEGFLAAYGWNATGVSPGDPAANYGRWPFPVAPRTLAGIPRTFLVTGQRTDGETI